VACVATKYLGYQTLASTESGCFAHKPRFTLPTLTSEEGVPVQAPERMDKMSSKVNSQRLRKEAKIECRPQTPPFVIRSVVLGDREQRFECGMIRGFF
jgi:hypothetical protein